MVYKDFKFLILKISKENPDGLTLTLRGQILSTLSLWLLRTYLRIFISFFLLDWFLLLIFKNWASKMNFFWCQGIFLCQGIFDFKNGCKNEFKDVNKKSNWSRNKISRKIDFKVQWLRNSHADSVGVNLRNKACWWFIERSIIADATVFLPISNDYKIWFSYPRDKSHQKFASKSKLKKYFLAT